MPLLFLHGQAFTSDTWLTLGTLGLVAAMGYSFVAVDLPGICVFTYILELRPLCVHCIVDVQCTCISSVL